MADETPAYDSGMTDSYKDVNSPIFTDTLWKPRRLPLYS